MAIRAVVRTEYEFGTCPQQEDSCTVIYRHGLLRVLNLGMASGRLRSRLNASGVRHHTGNGSPIYQWDHGPLDLVLRNLLSGLLGQQQGQHHNIAAFVVHLQRHSQLPPASLRKCMLTSVPRVDRACAPEFFLPIYRDPISSCTRDARSS